MTTSEATPVLIAAHNEARLIARTLQAFRSAVFEPIVIANACSDATADIARGFQNVTVYEVDQQGKLPALQYAVERMGDKALQPFLLTDADTRPLRPKAWRRALLGGLEKDKPGTVAGPVAFSIDATILDRLYNTTQLTRTARERYRNNETFMIGNNMGVHLRDHAAVDNLLAMPHIWRGDDAAISKMIYRRGGTAKQLISLNSYVLSSARRCLTAREWRQLDPKNRFKLNCDRYDQRAAPGSRAIQTDSALGY